MSKADRGGESHGGGVPNTPRVARGEEGGGGYAEISGNSGSRPAGRSMMVLPLSMGCIETYSWPAVAIQETTSGKDDGSSSRKFFQCSLMSSIWWNPLWEADRRTVLFPDSPLVMSGRD